MSSLIAENADLRRRLAAAEEQIAADARRANSAASSDASAASESRYRQIVESAVDYGIVAADLDGIITELNEAAESLLGWSRLQVVGRPLATIFTPEDVEAGVHEREMRFSITMGKARDERWHMRSDGTRFYASGQMSPLVDQQNEPIGFLKILRDRTQDEIDRRELEASRERLRFALDASAIVGTWDWDLVADIVYADDRFAHLFGVDPALGKAGAPFSAYAAGLHPDDHAHVTAKLQAAVESEGMFDEEYRVIDGDGEVHVVIARGHSFNDASGRPHRLPGTIIDVTRERKRQTRQTALLKLGDDFLSDTGPADYTLRAMEILGRTLDLGRTGYAEVDAGERFATPLGQWTRAGIAPLAGRYDLQSFGHELVSTMRGGLVAIEDVAADPITADRGSAWQAIEVRSMVNLAVVEEGRLKVILFLHDTRPRKWDAEEIGFVREVLNRSWTFSQRRRAERALVDAETRLRLAHEAAEIGTFDYDLVTGELAWDRRCRAAFGIFDDQPVSLEATFYPGLHPDDRQAVLIEVERVLDPSSDGLFDCVYRTIGREDAVLRWVHASGQTVVQNGVTVRFVGAARDVTEERESEERQKLLARELQHRVKNTLAMVNALANQTLRRAANAQEGLAAFSARLIALSHAHDILTQTSWTSAPIGAIVAEALSSHQGEAGARIVWSGPDVRLNAKQSLALALALHELATNALKYGSLSSEDGRISIDWQIAGDAERPALHVEWRESGGPPVFQPPSRGFGSRLIEQALAIEFGGTVEIRYEEAGVVCVIDAPITLGLDGSEAVIG